MTVRRASSLSLLIVTLGAFFYCYEYFLRVAPSVMHAQWMSDFHITATAFGLLSGFYYYAYTPMQLVVGMIVDRFRVRRVLIMAILTCVVGTFVVASTQNYFLACTGRFLQGLGSAFAFVGTLKLVALWLPSNRFALFSGLAGSLGFLGAAVTQIALAQLLNHYSWRVCLFFFCWLGLILAALFWSTVYLTEKSNIDEQPPQTMKETFSNFVFIAKSPGIWVSAIFAALLYLPTSVFAELWGIPYIQKFHHYTPERAALAVSMIDMGWAAGSATMGFLSDLLKNRNQVMRLGALAALVLSLVILYVQEIPFFALCTAFFLFGVLSAVETLSFVVARDLCHSPKMVGSAVAFVNALTMVGGMIFQGGLGKILDLAWDGTLSQGIRVYSLHAYQLAIAIVPISVGLGVLVSFWLKNTYKASI